MRAVHAHRRRNGQSPQRDSGQETLLRVMHVMAGSDEGGAGNIMLDSVLALSGAGFAQHVVTRPGNTFRSGKFSAAGIGVDTASFNTTWPFPARRVIADAISTFKPDVIEAWMGRAGRFAPAGHRARSVGGKGGYYKLAGSGTSRGMLA